MKEIKGVCPVIAMPFTKDGEVDLCSFEKLVKHLASTGVHGLTLFGIASEFHKLEDTERLALAKSFISTLKETETFSMLSVTDHSLEVAVKRAKEYEKLGADCLMVLPPFFLNPSTLAIKEHIMAILEAVKIPVLVQYAPNETNALIPPEDMIAIYDKYPHAKFKIESNPPVEYIKELLRQRPTMTIFVGYAGLYMLDVMDIGGQGVMPGCSFAEVYKKIYDLYQTDKEVAKVQHKKLLTYIAKWMTDCEYIIQAEKSILYKRGIIDTDYSRRPTRKLTNEDDLFIDNFINEFKGYLVKE